MVVLLQYKDLFPTVLLKRLEKKKRKENIKHIYTSILLEEMEANFAITYF